MLGLDKDNEERDDLWSLETLNNTNSIRIKSTVRRGKKTNYRIRRTR
jgi:hypothetical protein